MTNHRNEQTIAMNKPSTASFEFDTKARNLAQLRGNLQTALICDLEIVTVGAWRSDSSATLDLLQERFPDQAIIFRSSAFGEDSVESSQAGAYESIANVDSRDREAMTDALNAVLESYVVKTGTDLTDYQILVQPMVTDVAVSGVLFTRDLEKSGPYYVLNYDDETKRTDTVTAGTGSEQKVLRVFRGIDTNDVEPAVRSALELARELESVIGSDALDIEYAIDESGQTYLLQVRPLARTRILSFASIDRRVSSEVEHMKDFVSQRTRRRPGLLGETTIFGEMPDWNPAEIIGTQPKPLAHSLYTYLIMSDAWRESRMLLGYRHPFPHQLLVSIGGRPYVDVRNSFNSFIPLTLEEPLAERLVNHYLQRLRENPDFHDKVEFEILITCLTFDFENQAQPLRDAGFSDDDVAAIRQSLFVLTDAVVRDEGGVLAELEARVVTMNERRAEILAQYRSIQDVPMAVEHLLDDCIQYGTLPFSVFARNGFIATTFLKSLTARGVLTQDQYDDYLLSIDTVASDFVHDLDACKAGQLAVDEFLERYGHLRPGTYDIVAHSYAEKPEMYLAISDAGPTTPASEAPEVKSQDSSKLFPGDSDAAIQALLDEFGFTFSLATLDQFIRRSTQLREAVKFEFSKNLSAALAKISEFGRYHGMSREDLAFVDIHSFLRFANQSFSDDAVSNLRDISERNKKRYDLTCSIHLPDLIFGPTDIEVVALQQRRPNFITQKKLIAPCYWLTMADMSEEVDLEGKIVLIENADPGFDWVFSKSIAGLVTKYGGAASHLAIRCAEFGLPAAIGCGEQIFQQLTKADSVLLDCMEQRAEPHGV